MSTPTAGSRRSRRLSYCCALLATLVFVFAQLASADILLDEDFRNDPGWDTDQPANFYWKSDTDTYFARTYTGAPTYRPNRFGVVRLPDMDPTKGFRIRWDQKLNLVSQSGMVFFGIFADDLLAQKVTHTGQPHLIPESTVAVGVGRHEGREFWETVAIGTNTHCCIGGSHAPSFELGTWYRFTIEYTPATKKIRFRAANRDTGVAISWFDFTRDLPEAPFTVNMKNIGVANDPIGYHTNLIWYKYPNGYVESEFDNVLVDGQRLVTAPVADFTFTPTSPKVGQSVQFTDTSSGNPTTRSWTFGDGGTSSSQNPSHTYAVAGTFPVTLTVTNAGDSDNETKNVTIVPAGTAPLSSFTWSPPTPKAGQDVQFTDTSTGPPTSWLWTFGDGATSTSQSPKHLFLSPATYTVSLKVTNPAGSNTASRSVKVDAVPAAPAADFDWSPPAPQVNQSIQFRDKSTGTVASWSWTFGDGTGSSSQSPKHLFPTAGTYTVALTVRNGSESSRKEKVVLVSGSVAPCPFPGWSDLQYATDPLSVELERFADTLGYIPQDHRTLGQPDINAALHQRALDLARLLTLDSPLFRLSGYRPRDYQTHLYRLKTLHDAMYPLIKSPDGDISEKCNAEIQAVVDDVDDHGLGYQSTDPTKLSVAKVSYHSTGEALDISITNRPTDWLKLVHDAKLVAPCKKKSIHLQLIENPTCGEPMKITGKASAVNRESEQAAIGTATPRVPLRIMMIDPAGRRIGYDAATHSYINEIGDSAAYSGIESDPQVITIDDAVDGRYRLEAFAVDSGDYELTLSAEAADDGSEIDSAVHSGTALINEHVGPLSFDVSKTVIPPSERRRSVRH